MKSIIVVIALAALSFTSYGQKNCLKYVITDNDTLICKNLRMGALNTKCILFDGEKITVPNEAINCYARHGKTFEKLPVYVNGTDTGRKVFMEFVAQKDMVKIYRYFHYDATEGSLDNIVSYYYKNKLISSQTNPSLSQVSNFMTDVAKQSEKLLTAE